MVDRYNSTTDNVFTGGVKWDDNPNAWQWATGVATAKDDLNNVLIHVTTDANMHTWLIVAGDRLSTSGDSYIDFEFLQNTLVRTNNGAFVSAGPDGGRTVNDLVLSLEFTTGGASANFYAYRWLPNGSGGFGYVDSTGSLPMGGVFVAVNTTNVSVPFGAFGQTTYAPNAFAEGAVDLTALLRNFDPCLSIGVKTIMVKTKASQSDSAAISDFIDPIQFALRLGPSASAGPNQTACSQGASTAFALQGQATPGDLPITSTSWSVISGTALIDAPASLSTTAHVSSSSATLRLTVLQANGCVKTSDAVLTVVPPPTCAISGPSTTCPGSTIQLFAPAGMDSYSWTVSGNGTISGDASSQMVTVMAGAACGADLALTLNVTSNGCSSTCNSSVLVMDTVPPTITAPPDVTLECPADTSPNGTGTAVAHDGCSSVVVTFNDVVANSCGGSKVITRTWTATDACGNSANAVQKITLRDTTPPTLTVPANVSVAFTSDLSPSTTGLATAQDTCSSATVAFSDVVSILGDGSQIITRTWKATDDCGNSSSGVQTITLQAPAALVLPVQTNVVLTDLTTLTVINTATNPNVPANPITYQLVNPPAGVTIDGNGVITWTPTLGQSPSTNVITTVVTTTVVSAAGTSTISSTNSFVVIITTVYDGLDLGVDTDGDGLTNLVEFAVGSNPTNSADASTGIIVYITQDGGNRYLAMQFNRRVNAAALQLQYLPEVSADKAAWLSDNSNVLELMVTPLNSEFETVIVRDLTPITPAAVRFIRLHVIATSLESASPTWIGSATTLQGNTGAGYRFTTFSQRMVLPIVYAGTVSSVQNTALTDANATWNDGQFGSAASPAYAEFNSGWMVDIANASAATKSLSLAGSVGGLVSVGDAYRVRQHFTIASLFGTNNETGLKAGLNPSQADNILLQIPQTQQTMTIFYFSNAVAQGWYRADFSPAADQVVYPEQGVMVRRIGADDVNLYVCGPIKLGQTIAPVEPGFNLMGTLKSLSPMTLDSLNLYTGDPTTGVASGLNLTVSDNVLIVRPDGSTSSYFYFKDTKGNESWLDSLFNLSGSTPIPAGSAFFIKRQLSRSAFNWVIPAE